MAMTIYSALLEVYARKLEPDASLHKYAEDLEFAIGHAPAFRCLEYGDYTRIYNWCQDVMVWVATGQKDPPERTRGIWMCMLRGIIKDILPDYAKKWVELGKPPNTETWGSRSIYPKDAEFVWDVALKMNQEWEEAKHGEKSS